MTVTDQLAELQGHHSPHIPVSGVPTKIWAADVTAVNPDGTVDCRPVWSRAGKSRVPVPDSYLPAVGDRVLVCNLGGDHQQPIVVCPLTSANAVSGFDAKITKESPLNVQWAGFGLTDDGTDNTSRWNALTALLPTTSASVYFPRGRYVGNFTVSGLNGLTVGGDGAATTLHNTLASQDAFKAVGCDDLVLRDLHVQGTGGTRDGWHLENCQRACVERVTSGGTGRAMGWAQRCFGIKVDVNGMSVFSGPYPAGVQPPESGLVLTWDGSDVSSGCNQFVINGGTYIVGQTPQSSINSGVYMPGWAIQIIRADGGTIPGAPIAELSAGGVFMQFCNNIHGAGAYSEFNPSDVSYETGAIAATAGATAVVGTGTTWNNSPGAPEVANGFPGKYLVAPMSAGTMEFSKVAALTDATHLSIAAKDELLRSGLQGATLAGSSYRLVGCQLFLDACTDVTFTQQRGGSAILMRSSSRCFLIATCEELFADNGCVLNAGIITTNRVSSAVNRIVDFGANNVFKQINYQTNGIVQDDPLPSYTTTQLGSYSPPKPTLVFNSSTGHPNYWNGAAWVAL